MSDNVFTYFIKIIWLIAFINFALLIALPFLAEYISGDNFFFSGKKVLLYPMIVEHEKELGYNKPLISFRLHRKYQECIILK